MSEVNEAAVPKKSPVIDQTNHAVRLSDHAHQLMGDCHVKNTSGHATEWWKKAHASAIQAMPDEIKCHDAVKGKVGTTLWDIAHASLESQGQKGSVAHEMKRIADLNHISVDCSDLRNKEIRLHEHHAKAADVPLPPPHSERPLPPPPPKDDCPPHRRVEAAPLPAEPKVIMAPDFANRGERPLPPPPPREGYDGQEYPRPVERCQPPNLLSALIPGLFGGRDNECRMPSQDGNLDYYGREHRGYRGEQQFGIGQLFGQGQFDQGERFQRHERYQREQLSTQNQGTQYYDRAASVPVARQSYEAVQPAPAPVRMHSMQHTYSSSTATVERNPCPPGQMMGRNNAHSRR